MKRGQHEANCYLFFHVFFLPTCFAHATLAFILCAFIALYSGDLKKKKFFFFKYTINNYGLAAEINYLVNFVMATTEIDL